MTRLVEATRVGARSVPSPAGSSASGRRSAGYGLIELLVTTAVMLVILGLTVETVVQFQRSYRTQSRLIDVQYNARVTLDIITRLVRNAEDVDPDPDLNGVLDSITIRGDWNPKDSVYDDPYEDLQLTTQSGVLFKKEPADPAPVALADHVQSLTFTYLDRNGQPLADPIDDSGLITCVQVNLTTTAGPGAPATTLTTAATIRLRE